MTDQTEVVIVDGASTDNTQQVVEEFQKQCPQLKYFRESTNSGIDRGFDKTVQYASGKYCWLTSDDDLLKPQAIPRVLQACEKEFALIICDAEVWSLDYSSLYFPNRLSLYRDKIYSPSQFEDFFKETANHLTFIGGVVIKRELWISRDRESYFGTEFIHVGIIFQAPLPTAILVISDPLVMIRYGNAGWTSRYFEVWMVKWPRLIHSFTLFSLSLRDAVTSQAPWRNIKRLIVFRAKGAYKLMDYKRWIKVEVSHSSPDVVKFLAWLIAVVPGFVINLFAIFYVKCFVKNSGAILSELYASHYFIGRWIGSRRT